MILRQGATSLVAQMLKNLHATPETQVWLLAEKIPWRRGWLPTLVFLPGEFHGQRSLAGYSPLGCKELDIAERLTQSEWWERLPHGGHDPQEYIFLPITVVRDLVKMLWYLPFLCIICPTPQFRSWEKKLMNTSGPPAFITLTSLSFWVKPLEYQEIRF